MDVTMIQAQAMTSARQARRATRRTAIGQRLEPNHDAKALLLCRDRLASLLIAQSLPPRIRGTYAEAAEEALHRGRVAGYSIAFVDCDLPDWVFRKLHGHTPGVGGAMRVIGLRGKDPWRPMSLLAERLISSYVRMPVPMRVMRQLFDRRPEARAIGA